MGRATLLAKCDVRHAYHNVSVHPEDRHLLDMQFEGKTYIDTASPFGLRSAPKLFTALAEALEWIIRKRGWSWLLKHIDDFLIMGKAGTNECSHNLQVFKDMCAELFLPLR
jgi:hypothetical protein